ncbi:retrovirus-related pol polyprotein from transposon TNT 1-94 [Tanacetum coccineum]
MIAPGMYKLNTRSTQTRTPRLPNDINKTNRRVSVSKGVIHTTKVSRPQLRSVEMKDMALKNNSQVKNKKYEIEDHRRISKFSDTKMFVTACNDGLNVKTSDVIFVYLEVAFRKSMCFVRDLQGKDLLTGTCGSDLYTIALQESSSSTPICFIAKALSTQAWLWHRRLSHLNFNTINLLSSKDIVNGLTKLKYVKDYLCSSCELGKAKQVKDGENLDMKENGDAFIFVGYATRLGPAPQSLTTLEQTTQSYEPSSSKTVQGNEPTVNTTKALSIQDLELLFSPMFDEYSNGGNYGVSKSFAVSDKHQQPYTTVDADSPPLNIQTTYDPSTSTS